MPSRHGVAFRDPAALERLLGNARTRPRRAKQLTFGSQVAGRPRGCPACAHVLAKDGSCGACGVFTCTSCDETTTANGGQDGVCFECLLSGRGALAG